MKESLQNDNKTQILHHASATSGSTLESDDEMTYFHTVKDV